ncbi:hypothetical protein NC651_009754 [Populus alba x Populus x berolinensis]|nr:hypothetical protein NC651_009754 [Populus alba x Populus x berolinensis]
MLLLRVRTSGFLFATAKGFDSVSFHRCIPTTITILPEISVAFEFRVIPLEHFFLRDIPTSIAGFCAENSVAFEFRVIPLEPCMLLLLVFTIRLLMPQTAKRFDSVSFRRRHSDFRCPFAEIQLPLNFGIEEKDLLQQIVEQAHECKKCLREILDFALSYLDKDLTVVCEKLTIALKATEVAGVCDNQDKCDLELASARNSWRVRVKRLLEDAQKPTMQHIQRHMKEGLAMSVPQEDYTWQKLSELKDIGLQWADHAKKVATDSGALGLDKVFELISEGENLPIYLEKELKLLRARSMLYCICRKPFDSRVKVACKLCGEWYHIDCIKLLTPPKIYFCAACEPQIEGLSVSLLADHERSTNAKSVEPKTPSPRHTKSRKKPGETESNVMQKMLAFENHSNVFIHSSGIDQLGWQNRKPLRRAAKKRTELKILSQFFHRQGK